MAQTIDFQRLANERRDAAAEVTRLKSELEAAQARLDDLDGVIERLRRLGLLPEDERPRLLDDIVEQVAQTNFRRRPVARIRSTEIVADLVNKHGEPVTREEALELLDRDRGIPTGWANPRNAIGNALNRAVDKGAILQLDADLYAPLGYGEGEAES